MNKHDSFMQLALDQSRRALPLCRPNPPVGCVIVKDDKLISVGYTQAPGQHHAEIDAWSKTGTDLEGCDLYVTLEPCSFHGRTPSCAMALAKLKPRHIYIATLDTHSKNKGAGVRILEEAGINVTVGVFEKETLEFISPYLLS